MGVQARQTTALATKAATAAATATPATTGSNRTLPKCVRCRNHNEVSLLSGHKRFCPFRRCICKECMRTVRRQKKMAKQIAQRRRKKLEDERGEPVPPATPSPSTSSTDTVEPPTVSSGWLPYPERILGERTRLGDGHFGTRGSIIGGQASARAPMMEPRVPKWPSARYEQNVSSSSSGISSSNSNAPYAASCPSPTGSDISVTALSDADVAWPSDQRLRLAELGSAPRHSSASIGGDPVHIDLDTVSRLTTMVRRQGVDTETLLFVILSIVGSNVEEAYNRILTAQEEVRNLRGSLSPSPPLGSGRPGGDSATTAARSPTPPLLYRPLSAAHPPPPGPHPPPPAPHPRPLQLVPSTIAYQHLPFFVPIPRIPLGPPYSYLPTSEEQGFQYRPGNLRAASLSLTNVEEVSSNLRNIL